MKWITRKDLILNRDLVIWTVRNRHKPAPTNTIAKGFQPAEGENRQMCGDTHLWWSQRQNLSGM